MISKTGTWMVNPNCFNLRTITLKILGDPIFRIFMVNNARFLVAYLKLGLKILVKYNLAV